MMTTATLFAALAGAGVVAGLLLAVSGLRRHPVPPPGTPTSGSVAWWRPWTASSPARPAQSTGVVWRRWRWPVAASAGLAGWVITGWPVAAPIVVGVVIGLPIMLAGGQEAARAIDRIEAVEEWARRLSDVLVVGVGLDQAITSTVRTCPDLIRPEVAALAARLAARWSTESALRAFADDLDDASADLVVAELILGSRRRGPGLAMVLAAVADSVAEEVAMRRKVEAERAKPRATARAVTLITLGVLLVSSLNGTYLRPYGDALGQLVLLTLAGAFAGALAWMRALTGTRPAPRLLGGPHHETGSPW